MLGRVAVLACLPALSAVGCGAGKDARHTADARKAAKAYVHDLGARDGDAVCRDMTQGLQRTFLAAIVRANPQTRGIACAEIMTRALESLPSDQLDAFTTAKNDDVKVAGNKGSFVHRLHDVSVDGQIAREGSAWKVSCCVPGQEP
jgi:hypothetical protein